MAPASRTALSPGLHFEWKPAVKTNLMVVGQRESLALRSAFCDCHTIHLIYIKLDPLCLLVPSCDSLRNQHFSVLVWVHPLQMLFEIIISGPLLPMLRTAIPETLVLPTKAMFWLD